MQTRRILCRLATRVALLALLANAVWPVDPASAAERRRGWRNLRPATIECKSEFHDLESKWLQSVLVLRANWSAADELQAPGQLTSRFNVTVTVQKVLKRPSNGGLSAKVVVGSRITVGEFSGALARRKHAKQRLLCTPSRLGDSRKGYILFLSPTDDPGYFSHRFLPAKYRKGSFARINRVSCKNPMNCLKPPRLVKAAQKGLRPSGQKSSRDISMRFVCRASGDPLPLVRWLKDGADLTYNKRVMAQFKKRPHGIVSRLIVKPVEVTDAGNYTCQFSNLVGSVSSNFVIKVEQLFNSKRRKQARVTKMPSYMCDTANHTMCMNGGTCIINRLNGRPQCICPRSHSGYICEKRLGVNEADAVARVF